MRKRDGYQFDDDEQVEDGRTVRTPMMLMDGRNGRVFLSDTVRFDENHQPHFVRAADETDARAAARDAREEMIDRATSAWRNPLDAHRKAAATAQKQANMRFSATAENADPSRISDARDARAVANASYDAMCARLQDAWRTPGRDFAQPDMGTRPEDLALMRRHLRTEPDDDAQARRDAAWAQYRDQLGNAWKIDPRAATAIERQGERWRGG